MTQSPYADLGTSPLTPIAPDWHEMARCRDDDVDPRLFHPDEKRSSTRVTRAKRVCAECSVRAQCLEWALAIRDPHAVLGGTTHKERQDILRGMRLPVAGAA